MTRWLLAATTVLSIACQKQSSESPVASQRALLSAPVAAMAAAASPTPYPTRVPRPMPTRGAPTAVPAPTVAWPTPYPGPPTTPGAGPGWAAGKTLVAFDSFPQPWTHREDGIAVFADGKTVTVHFRAPGEALWRVYRLQHVGDIP